MMDQPDDVIQDLVEIFRGEQKLKKRKRKGRQGRSHKSRKLAEENTKRHCHIEFTVPQCTDCNSDEFFEDVRTGDSICTMCGAVQKGNGLLWRDCTFTRYKHSKPYQPIVHFRQRLAQLTGKDPFMRTKVFNQLTEHLRFTVSPEDIDKIGKKRVSKALTQLKLPRRYSANWIQIRRRMNLFPAPPEFTNQDYLWKMMNQRYWCLSEAFKTTLCKKEEWMTPVVKSLSRKNIPNVNYSFLQLLRLEEPSLLSVLGKFFPQLCSKEQPNKNNKRWKILMEYCKKNFSKSVNPKTEEIFVLHWEYIPLTQKDIEEHCVYFD